jgi:very-short-patch-repair endonuclease
MVNTIINKGYNCITQFEINKWFYDSYIPEKNLIIEFDGDYWHPKTIEDCDNKRLKKQWNIDRKKEAIAMQEGYNIVRIRESEKHLLLELI